MQFVEVESLDEATHLMVEKEFAGNALTVGKMYPIQKKENPYYAYGELIYDYERLIFDNQGRECFGALMCCGSKLFKQLNA